MDHVGENVNFELFDPTTFGMDIFTNPCEIVSDSDYIGMVDMFRYCRGAWCRGEYFRCSGVYKNECYHVGRIVESGMERNCTQIVGNLVMVHGEWKNSKFGEYRIETAKNIIQHCNNKCSVEPNADYVMLFLSCIIVMNLSIRCIIRVCWHLTH